MEVQREELQAWAHQQQDRAAELKKTDEDASRIASHRADEAYAMLDQMDDARRAALPGREVLVVGVPTDGAKVVQADRRGRAWRVIAKDGVARFPSLSTATWKFRVERFGVASAAHGVEIEKGDGPQRIEFNLPK